MSINPDDARDYTAAELLKLVNQAIANLTVAKATELNGRKVTRENLNELKQLRAELQNEVNDASGNTGGRTALVRFGRPR